MRRTVSQYKVEHHCSNSQWVQGGAVLMLHTWTQQSSVLVEGVSFHTTTKCHLSQKYSDPGFKYCLKVIFSLVNYQVQCYTKLTYMEKESLDKSHTFKERGNCSDRLIATELITRCVGIWFSSWWQMIDHIRCWLRGDYFTTSTNQFPGGIPEVNTIHQENLVPKQPYSTVACIIVCKNCRTIHVLFQAT